MHESSLSRTRPFGLQNLSPPGESGEVKRTPKSYAENVDLHAQMMQARIDIPAEPSQTSRRMNAPPIDFDITLPRNLEENLQMEARFKIYKKNEIPAVHTANMALATTYENLFQKALDYYNEGNKYSFSRIFDVAEGFYATVAGVALADKKETSEKDILEQHAVSLASELRTTPVTQEQIEMARVRGEQEKVRVKYLLEKDPTGFAIVNDRIKRIKAESISSEKQPIVGTYLLNKYQRPEYVIAGAQLGYQAYEYMYWLVRDAISKPPPKTA